MLQRMFHSGAKHQVVCLTANSIIAARRDRQLRSIYNRASLALPDGLPVVWASRLLGGRIPARVAGSDFLLAASAAAVRRGYTFYLLGGGRGTAERLAEILTGRNPGLKIVGAHSPPFHDEFPPELNARIIAGINAAKPDILWVGLGSPKQDRWIAENLQRLTVRVAVGIGAAFDMFGGGVGRAPLWMQKSGLEWFYRFLHEPRRLFRRYFIEAPPFIPLVILEAIRQCCFPG
jgi:N-acetylglucosaminyldiphosphoundecaprenol N-acetyl-beta-D-mannosaminyltransferase